MAIEYSLDLAATRHAAEIAQSLRTVAQALSLLSPSVLTEDLLKGTTTSSGTWVRVSEQKPTPFNPIIADLGFTPTVAVWFRMGKETAVTRQQDEMIRLALGVLASTEEDAVLQREYEDIWLLRKSGELMLSERADHWTPERLASVTMPYRRETYAFDES